MLRSIRFTLLLILIALLAACTAPTATPAPTATTVPGSEPGDPGYPAPENFEPPYPIESSGSEIFEQSVTPNAPPPVFSTETGAMTITLVYPDGERPVRGQLFFAASTLPVPDLEGAFIPALDQLTNKSGHSDGVGVLVISEIPPGRYALTLLTPLGPILVENSSSKESIIFEIVANELTDLGEVAVFLDPETLEP
jgi:hypothetical protein